MLSTARLMLMPWEERHLKAFAAPYADPEVAADLGGPLTREASDAKFDRYIEAAKRHGVSRWSLEDQGGAFLGYCAVMLRLGLRRDASRDFIERNERDPGRGLVCVADRSR
jgi:RimJ/RimL family protein N-acetyltransferase